MRALVTGGTGFIGGHLVEALRREGATVTALVRSAARAVGLERLGVAIEHGDLHDESALARAVADQEVVFHVAGAVAARDESAFMRVNTEGTRNLIRAAGRTGAPRIVLVSSLAAAGPARPGHPLSEVDGPGPVTAYGRSKLAGEQVVRECGSPWTILRPPLVYGPADTEVLKVFRMARRGLVALFGDGSQELSTAYGPDLAGALVRAALAPVSVGRTYYPCHLERVTSAELAEAIGKVVGRRVRLLHLPRALARPLLTATGAAAALFGRTTVLQRDKAAEFLAPAWICDPSALIADTDWRPRHDLQQGLRATARWYRDNGWL